jgi:hypothetical protein
LAKGDFMSDAYTGGCACGQLRFRIEGEPAVMVDCQCRDCQRRSGTGHGSYLTFAAARAVRVDGEARTWDVRGDGGTLKRHGFCPTCGTPVHLTFPERPEVFIVHAAALDEPSRYAPQSVIFTSSAHAWDHVDPAIHHFGKMPPPRA